VELKLRGKLAFITGASSGIGAAVARMLAEEGADVVVGYYRNEEGAGQTAAAVEAAGCRAWLCRMDIADAADVQRAIEQWKSAARDVRVDALILCAGQSIVTPFEEVTPEEWDQIVRINLSGPFYVLQTLRPYLAEASSVVTVSSVAAQTGVPHHAHYAAAKAGLVNLTKSAARALAPQVRVNCVAPGLTLTEMGRDTAANLPPDYARQKLLTHRFAQPEEIARAILYLASPASGFITGATFDANGGRYLR